MKILLVDDDTDLLDVTAYALRREGFNLIMATDGAQAIRRWQNDEPDIIILDVGLPRLSGFEVCRQIRENSSTPIILLTALAQEEQILKGFRLGADDYVTKPFSPRQLAMRIRAVARRGANSLVATTEPARELRVGEISLDLESHEAHRKEKEARLTPIEFRLLYQLVSNAGRVVSATRLVEYAWGYDGGDVSLLKTHICHIRQKLGLPQSGPESITAVAGVGYRMNAPKQAAA
jgi:DNA-binding response OmpR family regulator